MTSIKNNLINIRARIDAAIIRSGRKSGAVRLVAVSKKMPMEKIQEAMDAGQVLFGENFVQEAQAKIEQLGPASWHFIGHLQSNKAALAARLFGMIETVDRIKLAKALDKQLKKIGKKMDVLVQVNIGREKQKSGVMPGDAQLLLEELDGYSNLVVRGLMTMPPFLDDPEKVRPYFKEMKEMADMFEEKGLLGKHGPVELSMGMSGDFEVAIEEGATLVRVGTALFGSRY